MSNHTESSPVPAAVEQTKNDYLLVLEPPQGFGAVNWHELWQYRDLLYFLTWREVTVRYKQTALGVLWAILQPFLSMVVFTIFLGNLAKVPSDGVPYPVFSYLGLLPWAYFAGVVSRGSGSLVANANLLAKVYFPRVLLPLSATFAALVDFAIAFLVLLGMMYWYGLVLTWAALLILPLILVMALLATGVGLWLAALNTYYRDVQYALPFFIQLWMFVTPVVYPASLVPQHWQFLFALNPMSGLIEAYRAAMLGRPIDWFTLAVATGITGLCSVWGLRQFTRMERDFADVV